MDYIYARISKDELNTDNQIHVLKQRFPNAEVVEEVVSGAASEKPILTVLIARLQRGDTLAVYALDRLGRRAGKAIMLMDELYERGITVFSLREGVDYSTSSGRMIANVMFSLAQMERDLISERTKNSLARLKEQGVKLGPPRKISDETVEQIFNLRSQGKCIKDIAQATGCSTGRVCQLLKAV